MNTLRTISIAAATALSLLMSPAFAQDAMAPDAMAPGAMATDAMAPMSDEAMQECLDDAGAMSPADAMMAAQEACHEAHNAAMGGDAMAPADSMAPAQ